MRSLHIIISAAFCLSIMATSVTTSAVAQDVTLRVEHFISEKGAVPSFFITPWTKKVEKESDKRIEFEIYPSMQLGGKPQGLYDQIRDQVVDGGWTIPGYTPGRFPGVEVFELPFMGSGNAENTSKAVWEFYDRYLRKEFREVRVIAIHVHGPGIIHTRKKEVRTLEDMRGLKLRTPTRLASKMLEFVGASAIGIPVPAFPEALAKGVVDGGVIPWEIVLPLKLDELADSHTAVSGNRAFYNVVFIWAMNRDSYDELPDDLKKVIDNNTGLEASAWAGRAMAEGDVIGLKRVRAKGKNSIHVLSEEDTERWEALGEPIIAEWIENMNSKGFPGDQMVKDARAMVAKYNK